MFNCYACQGVQLYAVRTHTSAFCRRGQPGVPAAGRSRGVTLGDEAGKMDITLDARCWGRGMAGIRHWGKLVVDRSCGVRQCGEDQLFNCYDAVCASRVYIVRLYAVHFCRRG